MQFTLNGTRYIVDEYDAGQWFWTSRDSESVAFFETALEAQQDAIAYEQKEIDAARQEASESAEDEVYGSYDTQVRKHHDSLIKH